MPGDRPTSNCLLDLAPPDIAWFQERSDLILIPIGSCEQHGAHLPLGTAPTRSARCSTTSPGR
jgi:creatinine amidohydrolase